MARKIISRAKIVLIIEKIWLGGLMGVRAHNLSADPLSNVSTPSGEYRFSKKARLVTKNVWGLCVTMSSSSELKTATSPSLLATATAPSYMLK